LGRIWEEVAVVEFEIHRRHFPGWSEEKTRKTSGKIGSILTETLTQELRIQRGLTLMSNSSLLSLDTVVNGLV
jgi:hypothetical protein